MFNSLFKKEAKDERNLQLEFDEILKNLVFPFFKELGFRKKDNGFNKKTSEIIQFVNIQKSRWNHQDNVSFTFNIGFFVAEMYIEDWGKEIPKFIREYDCQINFRLGQIVKGNDYWYELNNKIEKVDLEIEIDKHLKDYLKPIIEKNTDLNSLKQLILNDEKIALTTAELSKIKMFLKVGEIEKAKELLNKEYFNALNPKDHVAKTIYPDGTEEIKTSKSKINTEYVERLKKIGKENNIILK
ncbi:hypothetical protein RT99_12780 [Flavobacterium sp. MEB061]|uniref:DUF4304 domain-containing protein n=1 Tax=Flavobacterium sp. MEB061 TaxID=1587524 RepID=UPI0005AC4FCC|nr:DUF4304 domain-containing protein [Flavobacterium sp. MEB061]KIQ20888.1 hypothetical protein RT99_12780 [Flavobacterium sp. MEB061]